MHDSSMLTDLNICPQSWNRFLETPLTFSNFYITKKKKNLKIGLSPTGKMYILCALLINFQTSLYSSMSPGFFNTDLTIILEFLQ